VAPTGLTSGRAYFNIDWITLLVMAIVAVVGVIVFLAAHRGRQIDEHLTDTQAPGQPGSRPESAALQNAQARPETAAPQAPETP
jgi:hypothetical protein